MSTVSVLVNYQGKDKLIIYNGSSYWLSCNIVYCFPWCCSSIYSVHMYLLILLVFLVEMKIKKRHQQSIWVLVLFVAIWVSVVEKNFFNMNSTFQNLKMGQNDTVSWFRGLKDSFFPIPPILWPLSWGFFPLSPSTDLIIAIIGMNR